MLCCTSIFPFEFCDEKTCFSPRVVSVLTRGSLKFMDAWCVSRYLFSNHVFMILESVNSFGVLGGVLGGLGGLYISFTSLTVHCLPNITMPIVIKHEENQTEEDLTGSVAVGYRS